MNRAWLICITIASGCFNHCDYDRDSCPTASQLSSLDGDTCDPDFNTECSSSSTTCICDSRYRRWSCDTVRPDMSVSTHDLSSPATGCGSYVDCLVTCFQTTLNASVATCESSCAPTVSGDAVVRYGAAVDCAETHCVDTGDGGAGACLRAADGTLLNEDGTARSPTDSGTGQKRCGLCLHDALAHLYSDSCTQLTSPDCNPLVCAPTVDACLND